MKDSVVAGIAAAGVVLLVAVVILLYIIISYRYWKRSPDAERRKYCLNTVYRNYLKRSERNKANEQNKRNLKASMTIEEPGSSKEGVCDKVFTTVDNSVKQDDVAINPVSVSLEVLRSPVRQSAETYSVVDLNDDG